MSTLKISTTVVGHTVTALERVAVEFAATNFLGTHHWTTDDIAHWILSEWADGNSLHLPEPPKRGTLPSGERS